RERRAAAVGSWRSRHRKERGRRARQRLARAADGFKPGAARSGVPSPGAQRGDLRKREIVARVAELAGDLDRLVVHGERRDVLLRHGAEDALDPLARAAAPRLQGMRREDADAVLVEEAEEEIVGREIGVEKLAGSARAHQHHRPAPGILLGLPGGRRGAAFLRQALEHDAAGAPSAGRGASDGQLDARLDLLRLAEVMVRALAESGALELDDALVAVGMLALVDGEGDVAGAEEARHRAGERGGARRSKRMIELF